MTVRVRALITRIQTMRTSTMVAVGVLSGLLLIFYIKETDYRSRVSTNKRTAPRLDKNKGLKMLEEIKNLRKIRTSELADTEDENNEVNDDDFVTESTSSTMIPSSTTMEYSDAENERENMLKAMLEYQKKKDSLNRERADSDDVNDRTDEATTAEVPTTTDSYKEDEVNTAIRAKPADLPQIAKNEEVVRRSIDTYKTESVQTVNYPKRVAETGNAQKIEMKLDRYDTDMPTDRTNYVKRNDGALFDIHRTEKESPQAKTDLNANSFHLNRQVYIPRKQVQRLPDANTEVSENVIELSESGVGGILRTNTPIQKPEGMTDEENDEEKNQIQILARKYKITANETDLPRQSETYTQRLRNKLVQTGRFDLIENKGCQKRLPTCLIVGVMKAGTEAFSTFLGVHPQVAMQFGYAAMVFFSSSQFDNGFDWYRERMMCSTKDQVTMEKSPQYFSSPLAPKRIYDMDPGMKLIILVRDPVSRAQSHFLQQKSSNPDRLKASTFEECVYDKKTKTVLKDSPYVQQSTYSVILKRWLQFFPYKQILIVDGDTFKKNPTRSLTKTESFLGIDHSISKDRLYFNKEKGFYCLKINSTNQEDLDMSCFGNEKGRTHPPIDPEVEDALVKYFQPYNEEFMKITGMKMRWRESY